MRRLMLSLVTFWLLFVPGGVAPAQQPAPQQHVQTKEQTVYITKTGKKYHRDGCRYLAHSKIGVSLKDAKANGYTACKVCRPRQ